MLTFFSAYNYNLEGETVCGCSKKYTLCLASAVELTLIIIGILAVAEVGAFQGYSQVSSIIILSSGGVVLLVDIIRAFLNWKIISEGKAEMERRRKLPPPGVKLDDIGRGKFTIDIKSLMPDQIKDHIYPVLTADEKNRQLSQKPLAKNEFILFFAGDGTPKLENVWMVRFFVSRHYEINDWLANSDQPSKNDCIQGIRDGTLVHAPYNFR